MDLLNVLRAIVLCNSFTHVQFEKDNMNPMITGTRVFQPCSTRCHICNNGYKDYTLAVSRKGLCQFLCNTFITCCGNAVQTTVVNVIKALKDYTNVGTIVYNRPRSTNALAMKFIQTTIMQLISTNILKLDISDDNPSHRER